MEYEKEMHNYVDYVVSHGGSDIHLVSGVKPLFRINRKLEPFIQKKPLTKEDTMAFSAIVLGVDHQEVASHLFMKKHMLASYRHTTTTGREVNFRVNVYLAKGSATIALRLIEETERTIEDLNLPLILKSVMQEPHGLFLVVGAAGNGKSTTLAAMINHCNNTWRRHILTIEDPVEFIFKDKKSVVTQREVPLDSATFRSGLDNALRADADIIMIGEMRENDTMRTVMTAAEVGHLVLSTVHASSATQVIHRIVDSFPPAQQNQIAYQLSGSLLGVCSVMLLPRISGGLIPACEVFFNNSAAANLIRENRVASLRGVIETGRESGMISLNQSLADLVRHNEVSLETARLHAPDEQLLVNSL